MRYKDRARDFLHCVYQRTLSLNKAPIALSILASLLLVSPGQSEVDTSIVLRIGEMPVSRYILEKNLDIYNRFIKPHSEHDTQPAEFNAWLESFIAKQTIIAKGRELGIHERQDIQETVLKMEKHMLSSPDGPFYKSLYNPEISEGQILSETSHSKTAYNISAAHFQNREEAISILGKDFFENTTSSRCKSVSNLTPEEGRLLDRENISWPFEPLRGLFEQICNHDSPSSRLFESESPTGLTLAVVNSTFPADNIPSPDRVAQYLKWRDTTTFLESRRLKLIKDHSIKVQTEPLSLLYNAIREQPSTDSTIQIKSIEQFSHLPLLSFDLDDNTIKITVRSYTASYNNAFERILPNSLEELRTALENFAITEIDYWEAKQSGIDKTNKFTQDKLNFLNAQVLDAYQREYILPTIKVSEAEIEEFYRANIDLYTQTLSTTGTLYLFPKIEDALQFANEQNPNLSQEIASRSSISRENYIINRDPVDFYIDDSAIHAILNAPPNSRIGPIYSDHQYLVFQKNADLEKQIETLPTVSYDIIERIKHAQLEDFLIAEAESISQELIVHNTIDIERYLEN